MMNLSSKGSLLIGYRECVVMHCIPMVETTIYRLVLLVAVEILVRWHDGTNKILACGPISLKYDVVARNTCGGGRWGELRCLSSVGATARKSSACGKNLFRGIK
jgi:hypothetical protein